MKSLIESLGMYLPANVLKTSEVLAGCNSNTVYPFEHFTGIRSRRMVRNGETSFNLAQKAIDQCLSTSKYKPEDVEMLISCSISRNESPTNISIEPGISIRLKRHFGFEKALAFDIISACTGVFTAILIIDNLLKSGCIQCGVVVSGEYTTHLIQTAQKEISDLSDPRMACLTVGDAGIALTLAKSPSEQIGFHDIELFTLGHYSSLCVASATEHAHGGAIMFTESIEIAKVALDNVCEHAWSMINKCGIPLTSFDHLIMHQTSSNTIQNVRAELNRRLGANHFHVENTIDNLAERGNTGSNTHFVAAMDSIRNRRIQSGDSVIFAISGSGETLGTALYTFDDLPDRLEYNPSHARIYEKRLNAPESYSVIPPPVDGNIFIESIGILHPDEMPRLSAIELAQAGAEKCFNQSFFSRSQIDLLIYTGVYRHDVIYEPAIAAILAGALDINAKLLTDTRTLAFDIYNGAMGFLNACAIATQMVSVNKPYAVMVIASENDYNRLSFPEKCMGIQETGSAIILAESGNNKSGFGHIIFKYLTDHQALYTTNGIWMNNKGFLDVHKHPDLECYFLAAIPAVVEKILKLEGLSRADIRYLLPPQISTKFISDLSGQLLLPAATVVDATSGNSDLFTSSIPFSFQKTIDQHGATAGDVGLVISVGSGLQIGCAVYYF